MTHREHRFGSALIRVTVNDEHVAQVLAAVRECERLGLERNPRKRASIARLGNDVSFAAGLKVPLRGMALKRLVGE